MEVHVRAKRRKSTSNQWYLDRGECRIATLCDAEPTDRDLLIPDVRVKGFNAWAAGYAHEVCEECVQIARAQPNGRWTHD